MNSITHSELLAQYARTGLDRVGIGFDRALQSPVIVLSLIAAINGQRKRAARQAKAAAMQYQTQEATC